jgi:hypothetical protein
MATAMSICLENLGGSYDHLCLLLQEIFIYIGNYYLLRNLYYLHRKLLIYIGIYHLHGKLLFTYAPVRSCPCC